MEDIKVFKGMKTRTSDNHSLIALDPKFQCTWEELL